MAAAAAAAARLRRSDKSNSELSVVRRAAHDNNLLAQARAHAHTHTHVAPLAHAPPPAPPPFLSPKSPRDQPESQRLDNDVAGDDKYLPIGNLDAVDLHGPSALPN